MINPKHIFRWCDDYGGGLVIAESIEEAKAKLHKKYEGCRNKYGEYYESLLIWEWTNDDYYDDENPDVFDIYS